jgi:beta-lactamase superfamily II metal-dependent hydrolase
MVFLAEHEGRSMLMTGDARGRYIRDGLDRAGRLRDGQARVDVLKLQHHGSARNTDEQFFQTVIADDYVISANGMYGNPDKATIDALVGARGQDGYRVWLTNGDTGTALAPLVANLRAKYHDLVLNVRPAGKGSQLVDLADPVSY